MVPAPHGGEESGSREGDGFGVGAGEVREFTEGLDVVQDHLHIPWAMRYEENLCLVMDTRQVLLIGSI